MSRDSRSQPANAPDSGRMGYRLEDEPWDERPCVRWQPFWQDVSEQTNYEDAVQQHPRNPDEGAMTYMARISGIVTGRYAKAGLTMPRTRMSQREWERKQNAAKSQSWRDGEKW